jgi:hypothetical protein
MTAHMVILLTQHGDGSLTSRRWTVTPDRVEEVAAGLGDPDWVAHTPASAVRDLAPHVASAAVVLTRGTP